MAEKTAHCLIDARRTHHAVSAIGHCPADAQTAYAVQDAVARACGWYAEAPAVHWKSGGPSRDAELTHAALPPDGVWASPAQAGAWPFHMRGIEAEIAVRLAREVSPSQARTVDFSTAAALIDAMCVSIEVVDSRWAEGLDAPALAKLADLQSHGALVLGSWVPFSVRDWSTQVCQVQIGAQPSVERMGTHPLSDPIYVLPGWLRHATRGGQIIPAGTVVTTGSWVGILHAAKGDLVTAEFPGVGCASVQF